MASFAICFCFAKDSAIEQYYRLLVSTLVGQYSIKELEMLSGIKAHTIRIWEQRYHLLEPKRTASNIRYYDDEQLKFLLNVSLLSKHGYKISHISSWSKQDLKQKVEKLYEQTSVHPQEHFEHDATELIAAMIDMDALKLHAIYDASVKQIGFENTIVQLVYPFLEKIGILWSIGQINPAHEHFMSSLIRQKIISGIDQLQEPKTGKKFMLLLPQGEHHEIGLLVAHYMLKRQGYRVFYLGADLPDHEIPNAVKTVHPDYVLTFLVDPAVIPNAQRIRKAISQVDSEITLIVACRNQSELNAIKSDRLQFVHQMSELNDL